MEKKETFIQNFATFTSYDGGGKIKVVRNEAGEEQGFEVRGMLSTFGVINENGLVFTRESYDKFVDGYYERNGFNVPLVIYHNDLDPRFVCGIVKEMKKTEKGVEMVGFVPRSAYFYNLIKSQVDEGILQGFSNAGYIVNGHRDDENGDALVIDEFALMHASMVTIPADTSAKFKVENTAFSGFGKDEPKAENKKNETISEDWDALV